VICSKDLVIDLNSGFVMAALLIGHTLGGSTVKNSFLIKCSSVPYAEHLVPKVLKSTSIKPMLCLWFNW